MTFKALAPQLRKVDRGGWGWDDWGWGGGFRGWGRWGRWGRWDRGDNVVVIVR